MSSLFQTPSDDIKDTNEPSRFENIVAKALSRLAAIQGESIPKNRFLFSSLQTQTNFLEHHAPKLQIREVWLTIFPFGAAQELGQLITKTDLPALWLSLDGKDIKILKGLLSNKSYAIENMDGQEGILEFTEFKKGEVIRLMPGITKNADENNPKSAWDWFFYAIKKRRLQFIEAIVATGVASVLALGISFYTMQVYDRVVSSQSFSTLIVITVGVLLAIGIEFITKEMRANILDRACKFIDIELSTVFFGRMLSIRMDARPKTVGTFASQIKQFEVVRNFLTSTTLFVFVDVPFVIFFIGIIWMIGGSIALVPLLLLPISILIGFYSRWKMANLAEDQLTESNQKNGLLVEAIDGIESIKAVGGEWKMLDFWKDLTIKSADKELIIRNVTNIAMSATQMVQQISYVLLMAFGVYAIAKGDITMGTLMACSILSNRALSPISQIAGKIVQWQSAKAALKGLDEMMNLPIDRNENGKVIIPDQCKGFIKIKDVAFDYGKESQALKNINLTILPGEKIALIGPVGSGKSTLIKILTGLYKPSAGQIFLDDVDMHHISPEFMRESIGYLTQDIRLFNGTLKYNLTIGLPTPKDSVILDACKETGLIEVIKNHPKGLDLPIFEGGKGLSGGQRQLVGLTRMLIAKPRILFLDEPSASMDGDLELKVMNGLFKNADSGSTILLSTHKMALLNYVDRVIVMDKAKIVMDGTKQEVIAKLQSHLKRPPSPPKRSAAAENQV